jgi:tripartite-type tricarboxylate transporter receptor subunit TctC
VGELAAQELGIDLMHVPYKGGGQAVTDVISGQVTAGVLGAAAVMPHLRSGKLVALAQTTRTRSAMLAQTPTLAELGARSIDVAQWSALFVPREVDETIARRMATAVRASLAERTVQERLAANSMDVAQVDPQQFAQQLAQERVRWGQLIKDRRLEVN